MYAPNLLILKTKSYHSLLLVILLTIPVCIKAQEETPLTFHHKTYTKGGSIVVGNTILGKHKSKSFDHEKTSNDVVDMVYVDVDNESSTFSSSSAEINLPKGTTRILYAELYWSGLYPAEKSTMRMGARRAIYKKKGGREAAVNEIKVKWGDAPYIDIKGDIVFDAKGKSTFKRDSPYVCRANITNYLNDANLNSGNFTAANIRAVRGKLEGGSAAGWHLYMIYENPNNSPKYFTTFDGFRQVAKDPVEITFNDFKTKTQGQIESTLVMATLEGDTNIKNDQFAFYSAKEDKYVTLQTPNRDNTNFFNSSITINSEMFLNRTPASTNTLGFDLLKMKLDDGLIANNAEEARIRFKSKADRFYVYFTAFETEIEETLMLKKNPEAIATVNNIPAENIQVKDIEALVIKEVMPRVEKEELVADATFVNDEHKIEAPVKVVETTLKVESPERVYIKSTPVVSNTVPKKVKKKSRIKKLTVRGVDSGYYLITNVFSKEKYASNWTQKLLDEGYAPERFVNPRNGWIYIYLMKTDDLAEIKKERNRLRTKELFKEAWIGGINR